MSRIFALIIGYLFGNIQAGYIYGKINHIDIRDYGSGNAGTTNVMRTLGKKAGFITYFVDCFKAIFSAIVVHYALGADDPTMDVLLLCYSGLGTVLGHNYPFYLNFKGGKGIAASSGVILSFIPYNPWLTIFGLATFFGVMFVTKYVSLASLTLMLAFAFEFIISGLFGYFGLEGFGLFEASIIIIIITVLAFVRHKANIIRLYEGNERKIGERKDVK